MGHEANIDPIQALDKQIEEGKGDLIKLKRARNSLLNISTRVPPEILGEIFVWSVVRSAPCSLDPLEFDHLREGPYDFILVCHHWFEVACLIPELWSFWGNTLQDWKRRYRHSGATPIDLVLEKGECDPGPSFDGSLQEAVRTRVTQGTIRRVHLTSKYDHKDIISSLTPNGEGSQNEKVESTLWRNEESTSVDVSGFFARSRLSKLRLLGLHGRFQNSSWDLLAPQTTLITVLSLTVYEPSSTPTTPQLLSILASNPNLQQLTLSHAAIPNDADGSTFQVSMRNLKVLTLAAEFRHFFGLLRRLILPEALDEASLTGFKSTAYDVSQRLAPYMQNYFRRDARFQDRLEVSPTLSHKTISVSVAAICTQTTPVRKPPQVTFTAGLEDFIPPDVLEQSLINFITPLPREHVVAFKFEEKNEQKLPKELFLMMPNIEMLHLSRVELSEWFLLPNLDGPNACVDLLPSLRSLVLDRVSLNDVNLDHLVRYLTYETFGGQTISLKVKGYSQDPWMHQKVEGKIKNLVDKLTLEMEPGRQEAWQPPPG